MNVLDLFSGIGGFTLGLSSAGPFRTIAFCEIEAFPRAVLAARWPGVPCYPDVRELSAARLRADGLVRPDLICGGFPCQDISTAGLGEGLDGERSKLWWEMHRIIAECRPRWVIAENSPSLRGRGGDRVLGSLEALGYACTPLVVGAVHAGAPHRRQRVWVLAYLDCAGQHEPSPRGNRKRLRSSDSGKFAAHINYGERWRHGTERRSYRRDPVIAGHGVARRAWLAADAGSNGGAARAGKVCARRHAVDGCIGDAPNPVRPGLEVTQHGNEGEQQASIRDAGRAAQSDVVRVVHVVSAGVDASAGLEATEGFEWPSFAQEPDVPRTALGVAHRIERIAGLGNAVLPAVVRMLGRSIMRVEGQL